MKRYKPIIKKFLPALFIGLLLLSMLPLFTGGRVAAQVTTIPKYEIPAGCPGTTIQGPTPNQNHCAVIPIGCPGTTQQGPPAPGFDINTCPFASPGSPIAPPGSLNPAPPAESPTPADPPRCESGGAPLSWIVCGIINMLAGASDLMYEHFIRPMLITDKVDIDSSKPLFQAWSGIRVMGNILLVIGMLIIVFGQAVGGGVVDAYTAKKVLPRIFIAGILINLSIYIVAFFVDITNIIGQGLNTLFVDVIARGGGTTRLALNGVAGAGATGGLGIAAGVGIAFGAIAGAGALIHAFLLFILVPAFLAFLGVVFVLVLRKGIIMLLIIVSPIALALYCLPNTEQYTKKWAKYLAQALLVYPMIAAMFGVTNLLAITISQAGSGDTTAIGAAIAQLTGIVILITPMFFILFVFNAAGGLVGMVTGKIGDYRKKTKEGILGDRSNPNSARNRARYGMRSGMNSVRGNAVGKLGKMAEVKGTDEARLNSAGEVVGHRGRLRRGVAKAATSKWIGGGVNYGNLQAERALQNEEQDKIYAAQYSQGDDSNIRALWAEQFSGDENDGTGRKKGGWYDIYQKPDGSFKQWNEVDVSKARSLAASDPSRLQAIGKYEQGKAANDGYSDQFQDRLLALGDELNVTEGDMQGVWGGIKFAHQGSRKEGKYRSFSRNKETGKLEWAGYDHVGLSRESADSIRKHEFGGFRSSTAKVEQRGMEHAYENIGAWERIQAGQGTNADMEHLNDRWGAGFAQGDSQQARYNKLNTASRSNYVNDMTVRDQYQEVAQNLESSFFAYGIGASGGTSPTPTASGDSENVISIARAQQQRAAQQQAAAAAAGESGDRSIGAYGLGGSARSEAAWKAFVLRAHELRGGNASQQGAPPDNTPSPNNVRPFPPGGRGQNPPADTGGQRAA